MAALDATMPTMLDFAKLTGPDGKLTPLSEIVPILNLTDMVFPRIRWMPANGKFGHLTTYDTELPEGDFTGFNGYSLPTKGTTAQSTDGLAHYQDYSSVDKFLAEAGTDKSKVLSANIWLTDISTWSQMNEVWDAWVSPGNTPARATVEAKLAAPGLKVEIMIQAAK